MKKQKSLFLLVGIHALNRSRAALKKLFVSSDNDVETEDKSDRFLFSCKSNSSETTEEEIEVTESESEVAEVTEVAEVAEVTEVAEVAEVTEVSEVAEVTEVTEVTEVSEVAEVTEVTEVAEVTEVTEAAVTEAAVTEQKAEQKSNEQETPYEAFGDAYPEVLLLLAEHYNIKCYKTKDNYKQNVEIMKQYLKDVKNEKLSEFSTIENLKGELEKKKID
ncbi:hypothetical protein CPAV1605_1159 [seawater metagenome]|uniref:Uncharacterized protein n=1 Tax=seawater metagenome TaxID=1561972 RepID=A0A5E8CJ98_9ZZZZ